jgi:hypothetical protein
VIFCIYQGGNEDMKTLTGFARIVAVIVVVGCLMTCDSYNIVEPRFYSDSDIVELSVCPPDKSDPPDPIRPAAYAASVCWLDEDNKKMRVTLHMPESNDYLISLVGSAGNTLRTLNGSGVGVIDVVFDASGVLEDGVYGVSVIVGDWQDATWFEIE